MRVNLEKLKSLLLPRAETEARAAMQKYEASGLGASPFPLALESEMRAEYLQGAHELSQREASAQARRVMSHG